MSSEEPQWILKQNLLELTEARKHLEYSFQQVKALRNGLTEVAESQLESVEAFTSRFSRSVDILVNKILRSVDRVELQPQGTLLDVVNRAEKRGFVGASSELREMKDVRNIIAHDYAGRRFPEIFAFCLEQKPVFDQICDRVVAYCETLVRKIE